MWSKRSKPWAARAWAVEADVSDGKAIDAAIAKTLKTFGKIDILVHGGGVRGPMKTPSST